MTSTVPSDATSCHQVKTSMGLIPNLATSSASYDDSTQYKALVEFYQRKGNLPSEFLAKCKTERERAEHLLSKWDFRAFSLEAHKVTGWTVFEYGSDEFDSSRYWFHTFCRVPNTELILDGKGIRPESQMLAEYGDGGLTYLVDVAPDGDGVFDATPELSDYVRFLLGRDRVVLPLECVEALNA